MSMPNAGGERLGPRSAVKALQQNMDALQGQIQELYNRIQGMEDATADNAEIIENIKNQPGILKETFVRKTADQSVTNSTTFVEDSQLKFAVGTNEIWYGEFVIFATANDPTPDFKFRFTAPANVDGGYWIGAYMNSGNALAGDFFRRTILSTMQTIGLTGVSGEYRAIQVPFLLITTTDAGTIALNWAQGTAHSFPTVVAANSFLYARRLV